MFGGTLHPFIGGPSIPEAVWRALEDDKLIFFCGAGVSIGAELPDFKKLTKLVRESVGTIPKEGLVQAAFDNEAYDRAFTLLEEDGRRSVVRKEVAKILSRKPGSLEIHRNLLRLALPRSGPNMGKNPRLVTTNFDRLFELAAEELNIEFQYEVGPRLGSAKSHRLERLTYLHGRIGSSPDNDELVLSSADFGQAYLLDQWAARYIRELFEDFTVVFIGYSLSDPVIRYAVDALAADAQRKHGVAASCRVFAITENDPSAAPKEKNSSQALTLEWRAKGVEPILYSADDKHRQLGELLKAWADLRTGGGASKRQIIADLASKNPEQFTDAEKDQVQWASEASSAPTELLRDEARTHPGWIRFLDSIDPERGIRTPGGNLSTYACTRIRLACSHLHSEWLFDYVLESDGLINPMFANAILQNLKTQSPLTEALTTFWKSIAEESLHHCDAPSHLHDVSTPSLIRYLSPAIRWGKGYSYRSTDKKTWPFGYELSEFAMPEVHLQIKPYVIQAAIDRLDAEALANLAFPLTELLRQSQALLAGAGQSFDSYLDPTKHLRKEILTSSGLSPRGWELLLDVLIKAFRSLETLTPNRALLLIEYWLSLKFSIFRRLALAIASESPIWLDGERQLSLLIDLSANSFWDDNYESEILSLIVAVSGNDELSTLKLVELIVSGANEEPRDYRRYLARRRLRLINSAKALDGVALKLLEELEKEEEARIKTYSQSTEPFEQEFNQLLEQLRNVAPLLSIAKISTIRELCQFSQRRELEAVWSEFCLAHWKSALTLLAQTDPLAPPNQELVDALFSALHKIEIDTAGWGDIQVAVSKLSFTPVIAWNLSQLLRERASSVESAAVKAFIELWKFALRSKHQVPDGDDWPQLALNHPTGKLAEAGLLLIDRNELESHTTVILNEFKSCVGFQSAGFLPAVARLAMALPYLYGNHRNWTESALTKVFLDTGNKEKCDAAWDAFLFSPRWGEALFAHLCPALLKLVNGKRINMHRMGEAGVALASASLDRSGLISDASISEVLPALGESGLDGIGRWLQRRMEAKDTIPEDLWTGNLSSWLQRLWPKDKATNTPQIAWSFAQVVLSLSHSFPEGVDFLTQNFSAPLNDWGLIEDIVGTSLPEDQTQALAEFLKWLELPIVPQPDGAQLAGRLEAAADSLGSGAHFVKLVADKLKAP